MDQVLSDEFLILLSEMADKDLGDVQQRLAEAEAEISRLRRAVFDASDVLQAELVRRYRAGQLANGDPPQG